MRTIVLTIIMLILTSCGSSLEQRVDGLPFIVASSGLRLQSEVQITTAKQSQIENGIRVLAAKARCKGYFKELEMSDFRIAIIQPSSTRSGVNVIEYNGGYIAGLYYVERDTLVLVDQPDLTEITINEGEHRTLFWNDKSLYNATRTHVNDPGHPIWRCP